MIAQRALQNFDRWRAFAAAAISSWWPSHEQIKPLGPSYQEMLDPLLHRMQAQLERRQPSNILYTAGDQVPSTIAMQIVISAEENLTSVNNYVYLTGCGKELGVYLFYGSLENNEMRYLYDETKKLIASFQLPVKAELTGQIEGSSLWQLMCPTTNEVQNKLLLRKAGHIGAATLLTLLVHHYAAARHLKKIALVGTVGTTLGTTKAFYPLKPPYDGEVKAQIEAMEVQLKTAGNTDQLYNLYYQHKNPRLLHGTKTYFNGQNIQLSFPPTQTPRAIISHDLSDDNSMRYFHQQAERLFRERGVPLVADIDGFVKGVWVWEALRCT